jgi:glycosyltransferase involved in cell wall biosynthesis
MVEMTKVLHSGSGKGVFKKAHVMQVLTRMPVGGITHQVLMMCEQLHKLGYEVHLAAGRPGPREGDCRGEAVNRGFTLHEISHLGNDEGPIGNMLACLELYRLFRRQRPALVHLHMFKARVLGAFAARLAGVPVVLETLHGDIFDGYYGKLRTTIILLAERMTGWVFTHRVVVPTEGGRAQVIRFRVAPAKKMVVQHVGFDAEPFTRLDEFKGRLRSTLGIGSESTLVGTIARLVPIKRVGDFLEAAALLLKNDRNGQMKFVIVGDGPMRNELEQRAKVLGLNGTCWFLGRIDDAGSFYADTDIVVLSSLREGIPIALLEAMASGKAIVATEVGGVPEIVTDGESALLVPSRNPERLAEAIETFAADGDMRVRYGQEARRRAGEFNVKSLKESLHGLYQKLLVEHEVL